MDSSADDDDDDDDDDDKDDACDEDDIHCRAARRWARDCASHAII